MDITRRSVLTGGAAAVPLLLSGGGVASAATWKLKWSPQASSAGLGAFEGVEDDRAGSHPGVKHIYVSGNDYRFDMHTRDRDTSTDRQRNEVRGMKAGGKNVDIFNGETWRWTYSMFIPSSLKSTTSFTHIMQTKMPGTGLRAGHRHVAAAARQRAEDRVQGDRGQRARRCRGPGSAAQQVDRHRGGHQGRQRQRRRVRWVVRDGGSTVIDATKSNVDTWLVDRLRPKWGIYRSLGDTSGSLQNCYLLLRDLKAYKFE